MTLLVIVGDLKYSNWEVNPCSFKVVSLFVNNNWEYVPKIVDLLAIINDLRQYLGGKSLLV